MNGKLYYFKYFGKTGRQRHTSQKERKYSVNHGKYGLQPNPCATTSHLSERPSIQTTKNFSVKALSLKSLVNEHLLKATANTFGGYIFIIFHCFQACYKSTSWRAERALFGRDPLPHGLLSICVRSLTRQRIRRTLSHCLSDKRNNIHRNLEIACTKLSCKKYIYLVLYWKNTPCSRKRPPPVSDH